MVVVLSFAEMDRARVSFKVQWVARRAPPWIALWGAFLICPLAHPQSIGAPKTAVVRPLTVADTVAARRVLSFDGQSVKVSDDGKRFVVLLLRGDLDQNISWMEVWCGRLDVSISEASVEKVAELFTNSKGISLPVAINQVIWLPDDERIALSWSQDQSPAQVTTINVRTREIHEETKHPTDVVQFAIARNGTILYSTLLPRSTERVQQMLRDGFAVEDSVRDAYELVRGNIDGWRPWDCFETYIASSASPSPTKIFINGTPYDHWLRRIAKFSPDGKFAVIDVTPALIPSDWEKYTDRFMASEILSARMNSAAPHQVRQLYILNIEDNSSRPLIAAPLSLRGGAEWSPDGRRVLIGPSYLPVAKSGPDGLAGTAFAIIDSETLEVDHIDTAAFRGDSFAQANWSADDTIRLESSRGSQDYRKVHGEWRRISRRGVRRPLDVSNLSIQVRQDLNTSPTLLAKNSSTGVERVLLDINPELRSGVTLGRVEPVKWRDNSLRTWHGVLYYPVGYVPGRSYPFVIQTHGYSATDFSLLGKEAITSAFAAQPLANHGMAVLQMEDKMQDVVTTPCEPVIHAQAYTAAIEHFSGVGLADPKRVGVVGFSRTGWHVQYAITHSAYPFAAAIVVDNIDASYLQTLLRDEVRGEFETNNGAAPFGEGLMRWMERAPGFNADKINTPLRMQQDSGGLPYVLTHWELFSQLRALRKPVELYVVPDIEHGAHGLLIPRQQLASRMGTVDWMNFWLNGREDPDQTKANQYARWTRLRKLHDVNVSDPISEVTRRKLEQQEGSARAACASMAQDVAPEDTWQ